MEDESYRNKLYAILFPRMIKYQMYVSKSFTCNFTMCTLRIHIAKEFPCFIFNRMKTLISTVILLIGEMLLLGSFSGSFT